MADYGHTHRKIRARWARRIAAGEHIICPRCLEPITPDQAWDLGHDDDIPGAYNGPEHRHCNRSAGGEKRDEQWHRPADHDRWPV